MLKASWIQQSCHFLLCVLAFAIPFPFIYASLSIVALSIVWILSVNGNILLLNLKERKLLWIWIGLYLLHGISYFYSINKAQSLFDLQSKLAILILPVIVGAGLLINRQLLERVFISFVYGISTVAVFCIPRAYLLWQDTGDKKFFFYHDLVAGFDANAIYMSVYTLFALSLLMFFAWAGFFKGRWKWVRYVMIVIQITFFILLSSRTLILLFFVLLIPIYLRKLFRKKHLSTLQIGGLSFALLSLAILIFSTKNPIRERYDSILQNDLNNAWLDDYSTVDETRFSNLTIRLFLWRMGIENIKEHNLWAYGAGNGDAQDLQNARMQAYHVRNTDTDDVNTRSDFYNLNLHNIFLQMLLMLGIPGLLLITSGLVSPFFIIKQHPDKIIFFIFSISSLLFMFQEAALQTQAGTIYYMLFISLFLNTYYTSKQKRVI